MAEAHIHRAYDVGYDHSSGRVARCERPARITHLPAACGAVAPWVAPTRVASGVGALRRARAPESWPALPLLILCVTGAGAMHDK